MFFFEKQKEVLTYQVVEREITYNRYLQMSCDINIDFTLQIMDILKGLAGSERSVQSQNRTVSSSIFYIPIRYVHAFTANTASFTPGRTQCAVWNTGRKSTSEVVHCFDPKFCS
jgi:hypothetical protein